MSYDNDGTTLAARAKAWHIFTPEWGILRQYPIVQLSSLCAMSVGLHPAFSDPGWLLQVAIPHFDGTSPDWAGMTLPRGVVRAEMEQAECDLRVRLLREFLRRVNIAPANLTPLGSLPVAVTPPDGEKTLVWVEGFTEWAEFMGWQLPDEFPRSGNALQ